MGYDLFFVHNVPIGKSSLKCENIDYTFKNLRLAFQEYLLLLCSIKKLEKIVVRGYVTKITNMVDVVLDLSYMMCSHMLWAAQSPSMGWQSVIWSILNVYIYTLGSYIADLK